MRVTIRWPAPEGMTFAPESADHLVGTCFPVSLDMGGRPHRHEDGTGRVEVAEVVGEGSAIVLAIDVPGALDHLPLGSIESVSISGRRPGFPE